MDFFTDKLNICMATAGYKHTKRPKTITIEEQNSSFHMYTTCTCDEGQLGQTM
jgi:hypothetical protein